MKQGFFLLLDKNATITKDGFRSDLLLMYENISSTSSEQVWWDVRETETSVAFINSLVNP